VGQLAGALTGLEGGQTGEASLSGRLSAIRAGEQMIRENPVVGVGLGQFQTAYPDYSRGQGVNTVVNGVEPHNLFLEVAAETGYLGVVGFAALVGTALFRLWRGRRELRAAGHRRPADLVEDVLLGLLAYLMSGMFVHNAYPRFFWLLIGIALAVPYVVTDVLRRADALAGEARPAGAGPRLRQPAGVR
jgi:O-antigen ligase